MWLEKLSHTIELFSLDPLPKHFVTIGYHFLSHCHFFFFCNSLNIVGYFFINLFLFGSFAFSTRFPCYLLRNGKQWRYSAFLLVLFSEVCHLAVEQRICSTETWWGYPVKGCKVFRINVETSILWHRWNMHSKNCLQWTMV